jgi:hypothetical protein
MAGIAAVVVVVVMVMMMMMMMMMMMTPIIDNVACSCACSRGRAATSAKSCLWRYQSCSVARHALFDVRLWRQVCSLLACKLCPRFVFTEGVSIGTAAQLCCCSALPHVSLR